MILKDVLDRTKTFFSEKNIDTARLDAELLLAHGLGLERMDLYIKFEYPLSEDELTNCRELVKRRLDGEPVAYIVGEKGFYTDTFKVNPSVLIPRPETELIVDEVLKRKEELSEEPRFLDLGTGSGCLGLSLLKHLPNSRAHLIDISAEALEVCKQNTESLELSGRCELLELDFSKTDIELTDVDFVVANPPYIAREDKNVSDTVVKYEPELALFSEEDGFYDLRTWAEKVFKILKPNGYYIFEIGAEQGEKTLELMRTIGYSSVDLIKDLAGLDRTIICKK